MTTSNNLVKEISGRLKTLRKRVFPSNRIPLPPRDLYDVGRSSWGYVKVGKHFFDIFVNTGKLKASDRVLDVGCGIGRMAYPLTDFIKAPGYYRGFDVDKKPVHWCTQEISSRFPHFQFTCIDLYNHTYNRSGTVKAEELTFPYADGEFDFIFLTSVFTHLPPAEVDRYLSEISRVLSPKGRCLATFFVWNEENSALAKANAKKILVNFPHDLGDHRVMIDTSPMTAVAYTDAQLQALFSKNGLRLESPIAPGLWCGRKKALTYQDCATLVKA